MMTMRQFFRDNGLALTMIGLFVFFLFAQSVTGFRVYNDEQHEHGDPEISYVAYLTSGHFIEATFENWESEYLQMASYVFLTAYLFQRGSAASKDPDKKEPVDKDPRLDWRRPDAPWAVRQGGPALALYEHSLTIALLLLFLFSFSMHAIGGAHTYNEEQIAHGGQPVSTIAFLHTPEFWFQSFQNWQSEFLAVASLVVLSIFLRQRGSPESKPVAAAHGETGG
jgi:uncharacterized protein DUF6766